jgi:dipeptidase
MCDTIVAVGNSTENGETIFAKNSDRARAARAKIVH